RRRSDPRPQCGPKPPLPRPVGFLFREDRRRNRRRRTNRTEKGPPAASAQTTTSSKVYAVRSGLRTMKELSVTDRPREKLLRHGAAALGDNELVALVL